MADFSIASQIGGGGGGGGGFGAGPNPNTMLQLMQLQQTMALQRTAEQRAAAAEGRAQALHAPQLTHAQTTATAAQLGLKEKLDEKALSDSFYDLIGKHDDPYAPEVLGELKKSNPKLYSFMSNRKLEQDKLTAETREKTAKSISEQFDYAKKTAPLLLANIDRVKDQGTYEKVYDEVAKANSSLTKLIPREFSPENVASLKGSLESLQGMTTMSLPGGDVVVTRNGQPVGMIDPTAPNGLRPFGPGEAPRIPAPAASAAAAPQTMGFSGMGQLAPAGQQAAQNVMAAFPGARITSGLRTPERNSAVGGATSSYHLSGNAIDVVPPAGMPMNVFAAQLQQQLGPQGYTVMYGDPGHLDHVHIQPGAGMNVPRTFSPSVAATDMAAGRQPMGMGAAAPANAMAPVVAAQLMQQNAMTQPVAPVNLAPGLTQAAPATSAAPRREDYATYGQFVKAQDEYRTEQRKLAEEQRKTAEERAKESRLPALEKEKATAKVEVETAKKEEDDLKNARNIIDELTKIAAPGGLIEQSTGSVAGRGFDIAASTFGASTEGSRAIARLGPIAARVLMTVPRFEGPQSNIDVQLYQKAAGDLANPTTPRGDRIAAAEEIARLWKKREAEILSKRGEAAPAAAQFTEGQTASNDKGERIIFRGGKWEPLK